MGTENTYGQMEQNTKETGKRTKYKIKECTYGQMVECIQDNSEIIICMAKEHILGQMGVNMKEDIKMTRKKDMEFSGIQMEKPMKETGAMIGKMVKAN